VGLPIFFSSSSLSIIAQILLVPFVGFPCKWSFGFLITLRWGGLTCKTTHQMYYIPSLVGSFYSFVPSRGHCGNMMFMEFLLNFCKRALSICFFLI
jgi:hypothetical protein